MKQLASIGLIFVLSMQCLYKLGVIGYFQLNRDYIAEVLCINKEEPITMCHGQCFLDRNLGVADDAQQTSAPGTEKVDFPVFLISKENLPLNLSSGSAENNSGYLAIYTSGHFATPFRPPSVADR